VTYVALAAMAKALDETAQISWDGSSGVVTVTTERLKLTAKVGQLYLEANGRYLYLPETVQMVNDRVTVPLWAVAKAFDVTVGWDGATGTVSLTRNSGAIQSGDSYYDSNSLFWLSRLISAESGNQPLEGKMAVGNVVMNRVASSIYPNTVKEVLAQKNQFSTYKSGKLADKTPNEESVIAAKLVLDGGEVEDAKGALYFDSSAKSWAAKHKECIATIGNHKFYR
jgi:N-acetylmuramoyl-L-alanine amidase